MLTMLTATKDGTWNRKGVDVSQALCQTRSRRSRRSLKWTRSGKQNRHNGSGFESQRYTVHRATLGANSLSPHHGFSLKKAHIMDSTTKIQKIHTPTYIFSINLGISNVLRITDLFGMICIEFLYIQIFEPSVAQSNSHGGCLSSFLYQPRFQQPTLVHSQPPNSAFRIIWRGYDLKLNFVGPWWWFSDLKNLWETIIFRIVGC